MQVDYLDGMLIGNLDTVQIKGWSEKMHIDWPLAWKQEHVALRCHDLYNANKTLRGYCHMCGKVVQVYSAAFLREGPTSEPHFAKDVPEWIQRSQQECWHGKCTNCGQLEYWSTIFVINSLARLPPIGPTPSGNPSNLVQLKPLPESATSSASGNATSAMSAASTRPLNFMIGDNAEAVIELVRRSLQYLFKEKLDYPYQNAELQRFQMYQNHNPHLLDLSLIHI